jgi:hypothetical protein
MMKFRKKPVVIDAFQWVPNGPVDAVPLWFTSRSCWDITAGVLTIRTLEGDMTVGAGDWIIRGVKGELYPCKPDIFAATYDPA